MKLLPIFGLLAILTVACAIDCGKESSEEEDEEEFKDIAKNNKGLWDKMNKDKSKKQGFAFRPTTEQDRKERFKQKAKEAKEANKKNPKFCRKANEMDALDDDELNDFLGVDLNELPKNSELPEDHHGFNSDPVLKNLPKTVDHRESTGPVESQGGCGSCWAFAASHTVTGVVAKVGSKKVNDYSEQQLTDCVYPTRGGCGGGWPIKAFEYLKGKNAMPENEYPYTGNSGANMCKDSGAKGAPFVTGGKYVKGEAEMRKIVAKHAITIAMLVGKGGFGSYKKGVYDYNGSCNSVNHAMTIVGYGSENGDDYWLVKNSWGANWGDNGYVKIKRGKNLCQIEKYGMYPTVKAGGGGGGGGGDDDNDGGGGPTWKSYKTMKYIYPNHAQDYELAEQYCLQQGSHLPTVDSDSKNSDLSDLIRNKLGESSVWIGANSRHGRWGWTDTTKSFSYTRWNSGQPGSSQCGYLSGSKWSAGSCNYNKKYVCVKFGEGGGDDSDDGGGDCKDNNKACSHLTELCNADDYVKKNCAKTCGRCGSKTTTNSPTTTRKNCVNRYTNCDDFKSRCGNGDWVDQKCQCTCQGSDGGGGNCKNKYSNCDDFKSRCGNGDWVDKDCQCTCKGGGGGGNCKNKYTNCDDFKNRCGRVDWVDKDCQCTCGTAR